MTEAAARRGTHPLLWVILGAAVTLFGAIASASIGGPIFAFGVGLIFLGPLHFFVPRLALALAGIAFAACSIWFIRWLS